MNCVDKTCVNFKFTRFIIETFFCYVENATYCILIVAVSLLWC